jgi:hypothetical protein
MIKNLIPLTLDCFRRRARINTFRLKLEINVVDPHRDRECRLRIAIRQRRPAGLRRLPALSLDKTATWILPPATAPKHQLL